MKKVSNSSIKRKSKYNLYDKRSSKVLSHNDRDVDSGLYYNLYEDKWVKRVSRKVMNSISDVKMYDFKVFSLVEIKKVVGIEKFERVGVFLSLIYDRSFIEGYNRDDWGGVYFSSDDLKRIVGNDWKKVVGKLVNKGVLDYNERNSKYRVYRKLKYFKLGEVFEKELGVEFDRVDIKDARFEKSLREYFKGSCENRDGVLKKVELTLDKCCLEIKKLDELIDDLYKGRLEKDLLDLESDFVSDKDKNAILGKLKDMDVYERKYKDDLKGLYNALVCILQKTIEEEKRSLYRINKDEFGKRLYHLFSNVPKEFRKQIKIDGEKVVEIDITASQPSFLCLLFEKGSRLKFVKGIFEKYNNERYISIVKEYRMDVYKYMAVNLKGKEFENDPIVRVNMKKLFFQLVFGDPKDKVGKLKRKDICDLLFGSEFYKFLCDLAKLDLEVGLDANYKNLAYLLQSTESKFLNYVMDEMGDIPFLPMHDSLLVKKSDSKSVKQLFKKMIVDHKLNGILTIS